MSSRDSFLRLPSWLIAASLAVLVVATLTYFITSNNDNTDEAAPPPDSESASASSGEESSKEKPKPQQQSSEGTSKPRDKADNKQQTTKKAPKKKPAKKPKKQPPEPTPDATVDVYNNSGITNLAASVASEVRSAGFSIGGVDNWYGSIPESTVYYPGGMEEQAKLLANQLGISRTMPAIDPMSTERLSVILTAAI